MKNVLEEFIYNSADHQASIGYGLEIAGGLLIAGASASALYAVCSNGIIVVPSTFLAGIIGLSIIFSGNNVVKQAADSVMSYEAKKSQN